MDKLINKHIDEIEKIEDEINVIIEKAIKTIDIDQVIAAPQIALSLVAEEIKRVFLDIYAPEAVKLGMDFGKQVNKRIEADRSIKVDNSNDPKLNDNSNS